MTDRNVMRRCCAAVAVSFVLLLAACGDDGGSDPDPGEPGSQSEIDGGEAGTDSDDTTPMTAGSTAGGTTAGGTEGNQITPGETTPMTAQGNG